MAGESQDCSSSHTQEPELMFLSNGIHWLIYFLLWQTHQTQSVQMTFFFPCRPAQVSDCKFKLSVSLQICTCTRTLTHALIWAKLLSDDHGCSDRRSSATRWASSSSSSTNSASDSPTMACEVSGFSKTNRNICLSFALSGGQRSVNMLLLLLRGICLKLWVAICSLELTSIRHPQHPFCRSV